VTGEWRKLHYIELYDLCCSPNNVRCDHMKKNEMGGVCGTNGGRESCIQGICDGDVRERHHLENPDIDGGTILSWIFGKWSVVVWTGSSWLRIGTVGGNLSM